MSGEASTVTAPIALRPPGLRAPFRIADSVASVPPHFNHVWFGCRMFLSTDGHHSQLWRLNAARSHDRIDYPRSRVFYLHRANQYEVMRVFNSRATLNTIW